MTITEAIKKVVDRRDLSDEEAESVLEQIMSGACTDAQIASLLTALRMKGETAEELSGFARVMRIELPPERISRSIDEVGIGFLHAPLLHEAMKYVALARKQMGIRTIFNMLGPLTNPAGANTQVIGVYAPHLTELLAEVLRRLGSTRALVVHGSDGLDEISITGESKVTELARGRVESYTVRPEDFGLKRAELKDIQGGDARKNAGIILRVLEGQPGPCRDIVLLNASWRAARSGTWERASGPPPSR
jgi:anthranilate phosphoribosyltransferase